MPSERPDPMPRGRPRAKGLGQKYARAAAFTQMGRGHRPTFRRETPPDGIISASDRGIESGGRVHRNLKSGGWLCFRTRHRCSGLFTPRAARNDKAVRITPLSAILTARWNTSCGCHSDFQHKAAANDTLVHSTIQSGLPTPTGRDRMSRFSFCLIVGFLCAVFVSNAAAQSDLGLKGAGLQVGFVNPEDMDATVGFGAFVDLGTVAPRVMLGAHVDYWSASEGQFGIEASVRDIAVGARAKYLFDVPSTRIHPFAGGGIGLHFVDAEVTIPDQDIMGVILPGSSVSDSSTKLGLDLGGGFYAPINPRMSFVTELWVGVVSDVNQLSFKIGMLYNLGS
jgi:hypothetical protein